MNIQKLSPRQLRNIIKGAEEDIEDLKGKIQTATSRKEKNLYYARIESRKGFQRGALKYLA